MISLRSICVLVLLAACPARKQHDDHGAANAAPPQGTGSEVSDAGPDGDLPLPNPSEDAGHGDAGPL